MSIKGGFGDYYRIIAESETVLGGIDTLLDSMNTVMPPTLNMRIFTAHYDCSTAILVTSSRVYALQMQRIFNLSTHYLLYNHTPIDIKNYATNIRALKNINSHTKLNKLEDMYVKLTGIEPIPAYRTPPVSPPH